MEVVLPTSAWRILGPKDLASKPTALKRTGGYDHAQRGIVDVDRWEDEGGALRSTVKQRSIPAIFRGRRDSIRSRKAVVRLLSEWRVSRLSRLVGIGLLVLVLLVIVGVLAPP